MSVRLFVGGLSFTTSTDRLREAFARYGPVDSAAVMTDRETGRSRGFGFVEMSSSEEAQSAITMFHGKDYSGRPLTVNIARPREDRPGGGGGGGYRNSGSGGRRSGGDRDHKNSY